MKLMFVILALFICGLQAQEYIEFTARSGKWHDPSNWAGGKIPTIYDTVYVAGPGYTTTIYVTEPAECDYIYSFTPTILNIASSFNAPGGIGIDGDYALNQNLRIVLDAPLQLPVTAPFIWVRSLDFLFGTVSGVGAEPVITLRNLTVDGRSSQFKNSHVRTEHVHITDGSNLVLINGSTLASLHALKVEGEVAIYTDDHLLSSVTVPEILVSGTAGTGLTIVTSTTADLVHVDGTSSITLSGPLTTGNFTGSKSTIVVNTWGTLIAPSVDARYLGLEGRGYVGVNTFNLGDLELLSETAKIEVTGASHVDEFIFAAGIIASGQNVVITADSVILTSLGQKVVDSVQIHAKNITNQCESDCNEWDQNGGTIAQI